MNSFFDEAAGAIGDNHVSRSHHHGALPDHPGATGYGDPFSQEYHRPRGVVRPQTVEEVQAIVTLANKHKVSLWTVSRGRNLGHGGSSCVVEDSVVLDLHRMNKIIELNEEYGFAIVEPGVSFVDLYEEIQQNGLNLWPSPPAIGWGSVIGNTLDRGFGYTPNGVHTESQCGMEVVLPNGDLLRIRMGAMADNSTFALYRGAFGPSLDGLFLESNFGIVTKLGIHITPAPEAYAYVEASVPNEEDLVPLIGTLSDLMRRSIILNSPSIGNIFRIALSSQVPKVHAKLNQYMKPNSCVPYSVLEEIRAQQGWGFWKSYFSLYGSVEMLPALIKTVDRAFAHIPGVQINYRQFHGSSGQAMKAPTEIEQEEIPHAGIPTMAPLGVIDTRGGRGGHVDYSPVIPPSGRELYEWYLTAKKRAVDARFDIFGDFHVFPRHVIGVALLIYAPGEEARVHDLYRILDRDGTDQGYIPYRTHVCHMERVAGKLDFNNDAFRRFTTMMKDTLDPNGILSPGKSGIWNSAVRQP